MPGDRRIGHQVMELASVGAGGVEADERNALPGLLEIDPVRLAREVETQIASDDGIDGGGHIAVSPLPRRGAASTSLK